MPISVAFMGADIAAIGGGRPGRSFIGPPPIIPGGNGIAVEVGS